MRRIVSIISVVGLFAALFLAQASAHRGAGAAAAEASRAAAERARQEALAASRQDSLRRDSARRSQPRKVDFMADEVSPYNNGRDSVICFTGNFAAHHNGAVIVCDSAVRYGDAQMRFFGRVIINQDSVYIYGDSAVYDGVNSLAEVYAPIVKVVDGDALLYTYNFSFNTRDKVGRYTGGGVMLHDDNIIESQRGYYYADTHDVVCVEDVEMHGADYDMKSDSVIYNISSESARFFTGSEIWNADGDYLSAEEGAYDKAGQCYKVTREGYVLTEDQEMWGDTIYYYREDEHVVSRRNIQMHDFDNKILAFGDYAEYWKHPGNALLTLDAAVVSYDTVQSDSVFMRADSIAAAVADSIAAAEGNADNINADSPDGAAPGRGERVQRPTERPTGAFESRRMSKADAAAEQKSVDDAEDAALAPEAYTDTLSAADTVAADTLDAAARKALERERVKALKAEAKRVKAAARKQKLDSIAMKRQAKATAQLEKMKAAELERAAKASARDSVRRAKVRAKALRRGRDVSHLDSLDAAARERDARIRDSIMNLGAKRGGDSVAGDERVIADASAVTDSTGMVQADTVHGDSLYRLVKAYRNVRVYRSDAQMVCDSMVSFSTDSIIHLYINPLLWNNSNQIASDVVDIYTANRQITRAEFLGQPIMVAEIDTTYYNQVAGKQMTAFFRDNEIYRNDVDGNVQTIYFQREDETSPVVTEMIYLESASASFYIEDKELVGMTYRNDVPFTLYPIAQVPPSQPLRLKNFKWEPWRRPTRAAIFNETIRPSPSVALSGDGYMDDRSPRRLILSTPADWRDVMRLRAWADAILVGAETVRRGVGPVTA
ncbi:MAG: hypothetical protein BHV70_05890 [Bacteroidales bacterium 55_9]|nr:MAG: hypothetical protein BHV70_05890 [Bacteroidales bacterium 55_9]